MCIIIMLMILLFFFPDGNECLDSHSDYCDDTCVNTDGSFYCTCTGSFRIASNGRSCVPECGGHINDDSGSISTPGWPDFYPSLDFTCEWTIETRANTIIDFSFTEQFGIRGTAPRCTTDYVEILDGHSDVETVLSLGKFCSQQVPGLVSTTSNVATIVFQASSVFSSTDYVGVNISFTAIEKGNSAQDCTFCDCFSVCMRTFVCT